MPFLGGVLRAAAAACGATAGVSAARALHSMNSSIYLRHSSISSVTTKFF